jgi:hypothetical protein
LPVDPIQRRWRASFTPRASAHGSEVLTAEQRRDLLEIVEDRPQWYDIIGNSTLADAVLERIVHNPYRIELSGETLRDRIDDTIDGASPPRNQTTALWCCPRATALWRARSLAACPPCTQPLPGSTYEPVVTV